MMMPGAALLPVADFHAALRRRRLFFRTPITPTLSIARQERAATLLHIAAITPIFTLIYAAVLRYLRRHTLRMLTVYYATPDAVA